MHLQRERRKRGRKKRKEGGGGGEEEEERKRGRKKREEELEIMILERTVLFDLISSNTEAKTSGRESGRSSWNHCEA